MIFLKKLGIIVTNHVGGWWDDGWYYKLIRDDYEY